jgi:pyruvate dehydrogenase E2 component (dihydrolipoamide acetyltransferase)
MGSLRDLVRRARANRLRAADLSNPTFTVTNLGELGVQAVFPSIVPPQGGAVGFGKVVEQPSAVAGTIVCSPMVTATLTAWQEVVDSHRGARFLSAVDSLLQHPETL